MSVEVHPSILDTGSSLAIVCVALLALILASVFASRSDLRRYNLWIVPLLLSIACGTYFSFIQFLGSLTQRNYHVLWRVDTILSIAEQVFWVAGFILLPVTIFKEAGRRKASSERPPTGIG
jgi:hypothetical protein